MKFECDSCHAQYMIADEKVGKRGVKVKCKRCSHVIVVRPDSDIGAKKAAEPSAEPAPSDPADDLEADAPAPFSAPAPVVEATGPARPAPVSMMANDTQLGGAVEDSPPSWEADKTQMGSVDLPLQTQADTARDGRNDVAAAAAAAPDERAPVKGESSIGDALDDQLAGAFNSMFDESRPQSELASLADNPEEQRGPTKILDVGAMNALRRATAETSNPGGGFGVDKDALASLRSDLGGATNNDDANAGFGGAAAGDDGGDGAVWHAAIDDEEVGPLSLGDLGRYIESGSLDRESLVWKSGMDNWLPAGEVRHVRDLFARAPMPKLAPLPPEESKPAARKPNPGFGFDIGGPSLNEPRGGSSPFDGVPGMEESDPAWQPHGLTDVYQAANLAEAAGASGGLVGNAASAARGASSSEPEWRPSASSALASLVNDEIDRLSKGPLTAADDGAPLPADDSSINSSLPFSSLAGVDLDAGPAVADASRPTRTQNQMPAVGFDQGFNGQQNFNGQQGFGQPQFQQNFAPPPAPPARSPLIAGAAVVGALAVVAMFGLMAWKVFFAAPVVIAGNQPLQGQLAVNTPPPVEVATNTGPVVPVVAPPAPPVEAAPTPVEATPTPPVEVVEVKDPPKDRKATTASKKPPKEDPKPVVVEPKEDPKPRKVSNADCDPVLDFDCKAKSGGSEPKVTAKATLEKSDILAVVKGALPKVKACGEKHNATGTIKMSWKIDKSGKPSDVAVADPKFGGTPVGGCVAAVVKGMRFPAYSGAAPPPVSIPLPLK